MKEAILLFFIALLTISCEELENQSEPHHENFDNTTVDMKTLDGLETGKSYLSVYSQIDSLSEHKTHNLTIMAIIRNISTKNTVYITGGSCNDVRSKSIRTYLEKPIYLAP